jgi:hypothetical protein
LQIGRPCAAITLATIEVSMPRHEQVAPERAMEIQQGAEVTAS